MALLALPRITSALARRAFTILHPCCTVHLNRGIKKLANRYSEVKHITVDSYNNDELIVLLFSSSMNRIADLAEEIKIMARNADDTTDGDGGSVFLSSHMCYGINTNYSFDRGKEKIGKEIFVNFLIEPFPGCKDKVRQVVEKGLTTKNVIKYSLTGGGLLHYTLDLNTIDYIYRVTREDEFTSCVKRVKLTMSIDVNQKGSHTIDTNNESNEQSLIIEREQYEDIKKTLYESGVSRTVRERTLSLIHHYNLLGRNHINHFYLKSLSDSVLGIKTIIDDFIKDDIPIYQLNNILNQEVTCLKLAIANRVANGTNLVPVLEYGCGIQQLLHAFGFAYQEIFKTITKKAKEPYSFIIGDSKECTVRTHVELNINHIVYPETFVTTILKEVLNNSYSFIEEFTKTDDNVKEQAQLLLDLLNNEDGKFSQCIVERIINELLRQYNDQVYSCIIGLIRKVNLIKYFISDYVVFLGTFQGDYELMWNSYLRVFLQESSIYTTQGDVIMEPFIFIILRLLLVGRMNYCDYSDSLSGKYSPVFKRKTRAPYDYLMASLWTSCMPKLIESSQIIFIQLKEFQLVEIIKYCSEYVVKQVDRNLDRGEEMESIMKKWLAEIGGIENAIKKSTSITFNKNSTNTHCILMLFGAFARVVDGYLDPDKPLKSVVIDRNRKKEGKIDVRTKKLWAKILSDPIGGFIIPDSNDRGKLFAQTTCFYRALWDLSYRQTTQSDFVNVKNV